MLPLAVFPIDNAGDLVVSLGEGGMAVSMEKTANAETKALQNDYLLLQLESMVIV